MKSPRVALVVASHNAFVYCVRLFVSLRRTSGVNYEVVVVDNRSRPATRLLLIVLSALGRINRLCLLDRNTLYAEANNIGVGAAGRDCELVLLLNTDVEIRRSDWLARLVAIHARGATAFGVAGGGIDRADGYCFLIDRDLYERYGLDESYPWWWASTRLQAHLLHDGHAVHAIRNHDEWLVHFGGKSGTDWKGADAMSTEMADVAAWFEGRVVTISEAMPITPSRPEAAD